MSAGEDLLARQLSLVGIPFQREYRFHPTRRWRVDFLIGERLAVEVEGGVWMQKGRHTTGSGFTGDCAKYNALTLAGYKLLRFTPEMVESGEALRTIEEAIHGG